MQGYRERLIQYVVAGDHQLQCLSHVPGAIARDSRKTLTQQLRALVDNFNAQEQLFESHALAQAQQAQQTGQRQLQAFAVQAFAACKLPAAPQPPESALTDDGAQLYRQQLVGYQSAVRNYIACLRQADLAGRAPGLTSDQRAQLDQTALQLGDAAILSFNQLTGRFNVQVPHLRQQLALAAQAQQNLAEVVVRGTPIFPESSWNVPAPLPADECIRISLSGQTYRAQLCNPIDVTPLGSPLAEIGLNGEITLPGDAGLARATQQEQIAAIHGMAGDYRRGGGGAVMGIAAAPLSQAGQQTGPRQQTTSYNVSELQIAGRHLAFTISWRADGTAGSSMHFDLELAPDNQSLRGYCWKDYQQRQPCTLPIHH